MPGFSAPVIYQNFLVLHGLHFDVASDFSRFCFEILPNRLTDVRQRLLARRSLRTTSRQRIAPNRPSLGGFDQCDRISVAHPQPA
jgi:hypothetical protein